MVNPRDRCQTCWSSAPTEITAIHGGDANANGTTYFKKQLCKGRRSRRHVSQGAPVEIQEFTRHAGDPANFWCDVYEQNSKAVLIAGARIIRFSRHLSDKPDVWREDGTQKTFALTGNGQYVSK
jgi:hypothetical protein